MKKILVFDMDGTLLDSMGMWANLPNDLSEKAHLLSSENKMAAEEGSMIHYCYEYTRDALPDVSQEKIYALIHDHVVKFYSQNNLAKPFVYEKLKELHEKGYKMYVATATDHYFANIAIKSNGLSEFITKIYTPDTLMYKKENIEYFNSFIKDIGAERENIIFFDDALYANKNANHSGIISVGVYDEHSYYNDKVKDVAKFFINNFSELTDEILNY